MTTNQKRVGGKKKKKKKCMNLIQDHLKNITVKFSPNHFISYDAI